MTSFIRSLSNVVCIILGVATIALSEGDECTLGKLFLSESATPTLHVVDLNAGWTNLAVTKLDLALQGQNPLYLDQAADSLIVTATFWGSEEAFMADGYMNLVHTGVELENHGNHKHVVNGDPYLISNVDIACGPAYHPVSNHGILAVTCDGSIAADPPINTTVMVFDEALLSGDAGAASPLLATYTMQGSHHGVAIPLEGGRILHSLATQDILNGNVNASSLPNTFQIVDYEGNVLETLNDEEDPNKSCYGYHGVSHVDNTFVFACSEDIEEHGGVLIVEFDEETGATSSRSLMYPNTELENHRSGGIVGHPNSKVFVADFADWDAEVYAPQMLSITPSSTEIQAANVLNLGELGQCDYDLEKTEGELVVVLLPSGVVRVYKAVPEWTLLAEKQVLTAVEECPWPAPFKVGYMSAFVFEGQKLFALDLAHVGHGGEIDVYEVDLGFAPYSLTVAGVPRGTGCGAHDHGDEQNTVDGANAHSGLSIAGTLLFTLIYMSLL